MSVLLAIWHAVPGWAWGGGTLAIVVLVALAFFAPKLFANIVESAFRLLALVPWSKWQTWAVIAVLVGVPAGYLAFESWLDMHDQAVAAAAIAPKDREIAALKADIKASNDAYVAKLGALQAFIDERAASEKATQEKLRAEAEAARAKAKRAADELEKRRSENVNEATTRTCPVVPLGVVLQFNAGAAYANGGDDVAVAAASVADGRDAGATSGVSVNLYSRAVEGAQRALRSCRDQVLEWQRYDREVIEPAFDTASKVITSCTPKGSSP